MEQNPKSNDRQGPPPRDGAVDALAGAEPDDIPMTGEEDPLAEVSDGDFSDVVAEFARSEHKRK
ncbi:hypothetical protein J2W22_001696 [Sphingomonas kyeonggiensis]|uniref:hypothetical protein n=1 Tax=Sphingomonas kyeonggiensis TaxID=1268553 RepID=UPI00278453E3|nr:hypothetical protein [Sphingomonas kyeonggiensis]MDQ0249649.1 hypothetical protein [Sphingomonas kyeonggiensis]